MNGWHQTNEHWILMVDPDGVITFNPHLTAEENAAKVIDLVRSGSYLATWQERLLHEHQQLDQRIEALHAFIGSADTPTQAFLALPPEDQRLLLAQYEAMMSYHTILCARVGRLHEAQS